MLRGESVRDLVEETLRRWHVFFLMLAVLGVGSIALAVVVGGATRAWLLQPGQQVPTDCILSDAPVSIFVAGDLTDDTGTQEFFRRVLGELRKSDQRYNKRYVPSWLIPFVQLHEPSIRDVSLLIPREFTVAWEILAENNEEIGWVAAMNLRAFGQAFRVFLQTFKKRREESEYPIYMLDSDLYLGFVSHTIVAADDAGLLTRALKRCSPRDPHVLLPSAEKTAGSWDVTGRLGGRHFQRFFDNRLGRSFMEEVECPEGLSFEIDLASSDSLVARANSDCAGQHQAELLEFALRDSLDDLKSDLEGELTFLKRDPEGKPTFLYKVTSNEQHVDVEARLSGLEKITELIGVNLADGFWEGFSRSWPPGLRPFVPIHRQRKEEQIP